MKIAGLRLVVLLALGVVDYEVHRPWRLIVLLVMLLYVWQWTAAHYRRETLRGIRQRRHRLANRLQLVGGWLQLGSLENGEEALNRIVVEQSRQSEWFQRWPAWWVYQMVRWDSLAEERGIAIQWDGGASLSPTRVMAWMLDWRLSQAMHMADKSLQVVFQGRGFRVTVTGGAGHQLPWGWHPSVDGPHTWWAVPAASEPPDTSANL